MYGQQKRYERCQKLLEYTARLSLKIIRLPQAYRYTWRHLACYAFIKIKFASDNLLFYVVYMCQKSLNFIVAFNCYKQAKMKGGIILVGPPCKLR